MPGDPHDAGLERRGPGAGGALSAPRLVEHFFRHEYGRLVAMLTRRVGSRHVERVEDAVQGALMSALTTWTYDAVPENPGAWLYRAASNRLSGELRQQAGRHRILERLGDDLAGQSSGPAASFFADEVRDDLLRMLFICCRDDIPAESRLVLALKTMCGFSTPEIALRLFTTEANVYKRLSRARDRLRESAPELDTPPLESLEARLPSVYSVLYLLFNEGYLSAHAEQAIRRELCDEAIRLCALLAQHPVGAVPETFALLALMHFHSSRLESRLDGAGALLLLEEQDRSRWDPEHMQAGAKWLRRAANGEVFSRYHAEAGIAAAHCFAPSFQETDWQEIAELYAMLERISPSPLHTLNRAVAVAEWQGPEAGLLLLQDIAAPARLAGSHHWDAVLCDLHRRAGQVEAAERHRVRALHSAPTEAVRELLRRRLVMVEPPGGACSAELDSHPR